MLHDNTEANTSNHFIKNATLSRLSPLYITSYLRVSPSPLVPFLTLILSLKRLLLMHSWFKSRVGALLWRRGLCRTTQRRLSVIFDVIDAQKCPPHTGHTITHPTKHENVSLYITKSVNRMLNRIIVNNSRASLYLLYN